ncbi:uncharacterized protein LOC111283107 [Durio zibethinus]|uniref:Uncharacterized protein LOC111283107 n=1 Tax=Durio zibethinus TaxID=66656 RepID=A0A6P5XG00_DURZI|nr:uncharacterized protein LOC111283107 [Durio zibethinus]
MPEISPPLMQRSCILPITLHRLSSGCYKYQAQIRNRGHPCPHHQGFLRCNGLSHGLPAAGMVAPAIISMIVSVSWKVFCLEYDPCCLFIWERNLGLRRWTCCCNGTFKNIECSFHLKG